MMFNVLIFLKMRCLKPLRMPNPQYMISSDLKYIDCSCGKCYPCLVNRRKSWLFRLMYEKLSWNFCFFVTLTYDDPFCDGLLHRDHLQKFLKRLRHYVKFKYYAIGEYGTTTFRPHYHLILFTDSFLSDSLLPWNKGFTSCYSASAAAVNYVLHFHVRPKEPKSGLKTFFACSKGLGISFLQDDDGKLDASFVTQFCSTSSRIVSDYTGRTFVLPRYYTKKMEEAGYSLKKPDSPKVYNPTWFEFFHSTFPDIQLEDDGYPSDKDSQYLLSLLFDKQCESLLKLSRYNKQIKNTSI